MKGNFYKSSEIEWDTKLIEEFWFTVLLIFKSYVLINLINMIKDFKLSWYYWYKKGRRNFRLELESELRNILEKYWTIN
jgi:hypothetical protein